MLLRRQIKVETLLVFLLTVFLLVFPKGGVKISGIPITWGYCLLFATAFILFLMNLSHGFTTTRIRWLVIAASIPFQVYVILVLAFYGYSSFGYAMSMLINAVAMPWIFVMVFGNYFDTAKLDDTLNLIRKGMFLVALYGIFLFVYKISTGAWIEIPFLTVNYGDFGNLDSKFINRGGGIFKLISTYNNGNLYGVCMLMLLPLFEQLEKSGWKKLIVKGSLILTLSRTVWIGLVFYELVLQLYIHRVNIKTVARNILVLIAILSALVIVLLFVLNNNLSFLFDSNLGGRADQFSVLDNLSLLPSEAFSGIAEILYLSVLGNFGLTGFILFAIMIIVPIGLSLNVKNIYKKGLLSGIIVYLVMAMSDGGFMLIPVMVFYWFVVSLLICDNAFFDSGEVANEHL